jgi:hypothetical protein
MARVDYRILICRYTSATGIAIVIGLALLFDRCVSTEPVRQVACLTRFGRGVGGVAREAGGRAAFYSARARLRMRAGVWWQTLALERASR